MIEMHSPNPEHLTVITLVEHVREEIACFLRHQEAEHACAFELFRRALVLRDEQAWAGIYHLYHALVGSWILPMTPDLDLEEREVLLNATFAKFALSIKAEKFEHFASVQVLLGYLKCCAKSVTLDDRRSRQARPREEPLDSLTEAPLGEDIAQFVVDSLAAREVWHVVARSVTSQEERLILGKVCMQGLSARELQQCYPHLFPNVGDVRRIKHNMLARLRHNRLLFALFTQWSDDGGHRSSGRAKEVQK